MMSHTYFQIYSYYLCLQMSRSHYTFRTMWIACFIVPLWYHNISQDSLTFLELLKKGFVASICISNYQKKKKEFIFYPNWMIIKIYKKLTSILCYKLYSSIVIWILNMGYHILFYYSFDMYKCTLFA